MTFDLQPFLKRTKAIFDTSEPDCLAWWRQQPVDLVTITIEDLEAYVQQYGDDHNACAIMAESALSDLAAYARFHRRAKAWVEGHEIIGTEYNKSISWRLRSPCERRTA